MPTVIPVINCLYHLRYRRINNLTAILSILLLLLTNFYQVSTTFVFEDLLEPRPQEEPYNKFHRPGFNQSAVRVSVYIHLESMRDISSETTLDFYLIQFWQDPRVIPKIAPLKVAVPFSHYVRVILASFDFPLDILRSIQFQNMSPKTDFFSKKKNCMSCMTRNIKIKNLTARKFTSIVSKE